MILVGTGDLGLLLTLYLLLDLDVEQKSYGLFTDVLGHLIEHLITAHLVLYQRISLSIGL